MEDVEWNGQAKQVAASWDELSLVQLPRVVAILYGSYSDPNQQRIELLEVLLGVSRPTLLRLTSVQLLGIFWLTDFLLVAPVTRTLVVAPVLRPVWWRSAFYAPADELANVSFLEFAFADAYFVAYCGTREAQWLDQLLGTLYRPQRAGYNPRAADYAGDRRAPFNENLIEQHAGRLARLPQATKLLVFTWYRGCRHALEQRYPHVFTPATDEQVRSHPDGWSFVLREMSGQAFGSFAETGRQEAGQVLAKMNDDVARAQELRRQEEAQQRATT
ncbi:MAG: hypothetical protein ACRYF0_07815 [Janthinobacterium lividum]